MCCVLGLRFTINAIKVERSCDIRALANLYVAGCHGMARPLAAPRLALVPLAPCLALYSLLYAQQCLKQKSGDWSMLPSNRQMTGCLVITMFSGIVLCWVRPI